MKGESDSNDGLVLNFQVGGGDKPGGGDAEAKRKAMLEKMKQRDEERKQKEEERKKKKESGESEEPEAKTKPKVASKAAKVSKPTEEPNPVEDNPDTDTGALQSPDGFGKKKAAVVVAEEFEAKEPEVEVKPTKPSAAAKKPAAQVANDELPVGGSKKNKASADPPEFAEKPAGPSASGFDEDKPLNNKKSTMMMSEYPEGEGPPGESIDDGTIKIQAKGAYNLDELDDANPFGAAAVEDEATLRKGPVEVRAVDKKSVKKRMYAFQDLLEIAKTNISDPVFNGDVIGKFHAYLDETNPAAFDAALDLVSYYIMNGGKSSGYNFDGIMKHLIEKGFTSLKPATKSNSQTLLDFFFKKGQKDDIFSAISAIISKSLGVWKFVVSAFDALKFLLEKNGPQKMDLCKPLIPACIKACAAPKPQTKDAAIDFLKECILYIGPAFLSLVDGLNKAQVKALEDFVKVNPVPTKGPKKSTATKGPAGEAAEEEDDAPMQVGMDAYDIATPVDIFKTYNEAFFESVFTLGRWNEKKAKLDEFLEKGKKTPRFANVSVSWISNIVKRLFMDPNKNVQKATLSVLAVCAKGMRKNFSAIAKKEVGGLLQKFRESSFIDDIFNVLTAFNYCLRPDEVIEDILVALAPKEKHIGVKINTIDWLVKSLKANPEGTETLADKLLPSTLVPLLDEGDKGVREAASKLIGLFVYTCGEDRFTKCLGKVAQPKMKAVLKYASEFEKDPTPADNAKVDPKKAGAQKGSAGPTASPKPAANKGNTKAEMDDTPTTSPSAKPSAPKPPARKKFEEFSDEPVSAKVVEAPRLAEPNMTIDEVEIKLRDMEFDDGVLKKLGSQNWEVKTEALSATLGWLSDNAGFSEEIMILIKEKTKSFSFAHTQFNKELFSGLMSISEDLECKKKLFNEVNVRIMLELCLERMNEKTYVAKIQDLLIRGFSTVNPKATISTLLDMIKRRTLGPKLVEVLSEILPKLISVVTINFLPTNELITFAKYTFEQKQSTHRKIGTIIICGLYAMAGPKIKDYLQDVNSAILTTLETELKRVNVNLKAMPSIEIFGNKAGVSAQETLSLPVTDVSSTLNNLVTSLEHSNWQKRKEALEAASAALVEAGFNIKPAGLDNFLTSVVKRLEDSNKAPLKLAIELSGGLAKSLGKHFKPWIKQMLPCLIKNLQDKQSPIREDVIRSIQSMFDAVETEQDYIIKEFFNNLGHESIELKQEVLAFLNNHSEAMACVDIKPNLMDFIIKGIENRNKPIRDGFELLFKHLAELKGEEIFTRAAVSLTPATQKTIKTLLSKQPEREETTEPTMSVRPSVTAGKKPAPSVQAEPNFATNSTPDVPVQPQVSVNTNAVYSQHGSVPSRVDSDPNKIIVTSGQRKVRLMQTPWSLDGPSDQQLAEFYNHMSKHFNQKLIKGMFSLETESFHTAINEIHKTMQNETEIFMDVQDLVLQWIFLRSFEMRPHLTTFYIQFLTELMTKYAGANLLTEQERSLVITSFIQLYIACSRYLDTSYFHNLVALICSNGGWSPFFYVLEWNLKENQIIERFHMNDIVELFALGIKYVPSTHIANLAFITKAVIGSCYGKCSHDLLKKSFELLAQIYILNPEVMESYFTDPQDQAIAAIRHIAERGGLQGTEVQDGTQGFEGMQSGYTPSPQRQMSPSGERNIRNEIVEVPQISPDDTGYDDQEDLPQDAHNGDPTSMSLRGQLESFINTFLGADESTVAHYLEVLGQWLTNSSMASLLVENCNPIVVNLTRYFQQVCSGVETSKLNLYLQLIENLEKISGMEHLVKDLSESTVFELLDTLLYILIIVNDYKAKFVEKSTEYQVMSKIITSLNNSVLKLIANGDCNTVYVTLFQLLIKSRMEPVPEKFDGLVSKCILKTTQRIEGIADQINLEAVIHSMHQYLFALTQSGIDKKEDIGVKTVKTTLNALLDKYDDDVVLAAYKNVYQTHSIPEEPNLAKWLKQLIKAKTRSHFLEFGELSTIASTEALPHTPNPNQRQTAHSRLPPPTGARKPETGKEVPPRKASISHEVSQHLEDKRRQAAMASSELPQIEVRSRNKSPLNKQAVNEYYADYTESNRQSEAPQHQFDEEGDDLSSKIMGVINQIREVAQMAMPPLLRQLTTLLYTDANELDISPLLAELEPARRAMVLKHVDMVYAKRREGAPTPSEMSNSKYNSVNQSFRDTTGLSDSKGPTKLQSIRESRMLTRGGSQSNSHSQKQMAPVSQGTVSRMSTKRPLEETSTNKLQEAQKRMAQTGSLSQKH